MYTGDSGIVLIGRRCSSCGKRLEVLRVLDNRIILTCEDCRGIYEFYFGDGEDDEKYD